MSDLIRPLKLCPDCGLEKPAEEFGRNKRMTDGLARYCKECFGRRSKASYRKRMAEGGRLVRERPEAPEGSKYCPQCGESKSCSEFGRNKAKNHGSTRSYFLKRRYGLTEEDVAAILRRQAHLCLICLRTRSLHVDHDHATGDVRGLLCFGCNGGLGQFKDDPRVVRRAVDYLEERFLTPEREKPRPSGDADRPGRRSNRHRHLVRRYGIGADEVERLVDSRGTCVPSAGMRPRRPSIMIT